ncbi:hypothetical protein [[Phormidium] sp. ETS-05]|uniref:hypothetical protein n=1 Tax=[Phormidium] sp. ETS-05 TaxID=222819 RepID=UPI0018EEF3DE|nr:hypothetical protein [[Phormidium] sp. ETS-05]
MYINTKPPTSDRQSINFNPGLYEEISSILLTIVWDDYTIYNITELAGATIKSYPTKFANPK